MTTTFPRTMLGLEYENEDEAFGPLRDSSDVSTNYDELNARMRSDGYLFLPGYLNRDEVIEARMECARRLHDAGMLHPDYPIEDTIVAPEGNVGFHPSLAKDNAPLMKVLYDGPMIRLFEGLFNEPVRHFDFTWFRSVTRGKGHTTAPHMDAVYMNRGTHRLFTAWTPIGDIPVEQGGLTILENSHLHERLNKGYALKDVDKFCENRRDAGFKEMGGGGNIRAGGNLTLDPVKLRKNLGGRWLHAEYRMGDLLVFSIFTVHGGLDNHTNRIRLSSDSRYQRASEPADERWVGEKPIGHGPEGKRGMIC